MLPVPTCAAIAVVSAWNVTHAILARLFAVEREVAEQPLPARAELADLHKARADGEEDARADEQVEQYAVPHDVADLAYKVSQLIH